MTFWILVYLSSALAFAAIWSIWDSLSAMHPWKLRVNHEEILVATPWRIVWIADDAFDFCTNSRWSGIRAWKMENGEMVEVYAYIAEVRFLP